MIAYYNEIDPYAAQWLRNLINAGHIAPGIVDERSIEDVRPSDLQEFTQCHFFAGIGVWSLALRNAGWPDDRPVWTGSCPCQPFSAAGKGVGFDDERHLWPAFYHLIEQCSPAIVLGEQVASKDADPWIDLVQADMEAVDYAFGAIPFPSAGVGAPHIRDRLYWVATNRMAHAAGDGRQRGRTGQARDGRDAARIESERFRDAGGMAGTVQSGRPEGRAESGQRQVTRLRKSSGLADTDSPRPHASAFGGIHSSEEGTGTWNGESERFGAASEWPGPTNGLWRDADWLLCRDGKWRPVRPGTQPLVDGAPARVGRLRAYGNAINSQAAQVFIESVMECLP